MFVLDEIHVKGPTLAYKHVRLENSGKTSPGSSKDP